MKIAYPFLVLIAGIWILAAQWTWMLLTREDSALLRRLSWWVEKTLNRL